MKDIRKWFYAKHAVFLGVLTVFCSPIYHGAIQLGAPREIHGICPELMAWQKRFHDRIMKNEENDLRIRRYIDENPAK